MVMTLISPSMSFQFSLGADSTETRRSIRLHVSIDGVPLVVGAECLMPQAESCLDGQSHRAVPIWEQFCGLQYAGRG